MMCDKCWANNDGGIWCWKHTLEATEQDCMKCKGIILIDDYRKEKELPTTLWREFKWKEG